MPDAGPCLHISIFVQLEEANIIGDYLVRARGKGRNQCRLAGAGLADKSDTAARDVNRGRVERGNPALMA